MREPNLLYTDVEDALREALRDLLTARCPASAVTALYDGDRSIVPASVEVAGRRVGSGRPAGAGIGGRSGRHGPRGGRLSRRSSAGSRRRRRF